MGYLSLIPGLGRSLGERNAYPFQYSCQENSMDRGAWNSTSWGHKESNMNASQRLQHSHWSRSRYLCVGGYFFFFYDPMDIGNLISDSSIFSKYSLYIWNFLVHVLLKPRLEDLEHYFASLWNEYNCMVVWTIFGILFLWAWNKNWPFPVLWPLMDIPNLLMYWMQCFNSIIF